MAGQKNANAKPELLKRETCSQQLRNACAKGSDWQEYTKLFGVTVSNGTQLAQIEQDVAFFLLARGRYAYLGWGEWGMTWPFNPEPAHGELPPLPHGVPRPTIIDRDFGEPEQDICVEEQPNIFVRRWSS